MSGHTRVKWFEAGDGGENDYAQFGIVVRRQQWMRSCRRCEEPKLPKRSGRHKSNNTEKPMQSRDLEPAV